MLTEISINSITPAQDNTNKCTVYIFANEKQIIFPIQMNTDEAKCLVKTLYKGNTEGNIYETTKRLAAALNAKITSIIIYKYLDGIFYTYIRVTKQEEVLDINVKFSDALILATACNLPIYIKDQIITDFGIELVSKNTTATGNAFKITV